MSKYLIISTQILPEIYEKVLRAKELLRMGKAKDITEAVKACEISRSSYYKYKDYVFSVSEGSHAKKATISFSVAHQAGKLSNVLDRIAYVNGNILTINQDIPVSNIANIRITFDVSNMNIELNSLLEEIKSMDNVIEVKLLAMG
ncbi:ACT domain-containing protein [Clostridium aestuarii]|uniref:UPF0735 ACT domain-containing protein OW763_12020 n=1 Tax=Clostridium aestuarii TaxID=338193 RepID=A0ABT4D4C9_9CLOT|nr:ACT domain-containing protein [Clostridium aestuarii]MCY6485065.1 ACT domain-containing protein [Clostridium aestuarii]